MSNRELGQIPVLEWSPNQVRVFHPATGRTTVGASLGAVRGSLADADEVVVAVSRRSSFLRTARLPDAAKAEVAKILGIQIGQLLPVSPTDAAIDFYLTDDRNVEGRLAVIAAVKSDTLHALQDDLNAHGLRARCVVPSALGSALLARAQGKQECAILEEVPEGLAIDIVSEGELRVSRVVPTPAPSEVEAEILRSFSIAKVPASETVSLAGAYQNGQSHLPASGLALLSGGALPLNLEPPEVVSKRASDRIVRARRVALAMWVAALGLAAVVFDWRSTDAAVVAKGEAKWRSTLGSLRKTKDQATAKLASLTKVDNALQVTFEPKQKLSDVVFILNSLAPEGLWLTGINVERGKLAQVRGTATNGEAVTKYLERLSTLNRFRDVKLVFANNGQIEKVNVVQFSISAHVVGNFPLDPEATK